MIFYRFFSSVFIRIPRARFFIYFLIKYIKSYLKYVKIRKIVHENVRRINTRVENARIVKK